MAAEGERYQPKDTLSNTLSSTLQTTAFGAILAGAQNTLTRQNVGAMGIITRSGGTIALFASMGAAFQFTVDSAANLRQKDDSYNHAMAGFMAGLIPGLPKRSLPMMLGTGAGLAVVMSAYNYTQGFFPDKKDQEIDEYERKEMMKKNRRRPIEETISELGEGRGIYAPGWEERRRERIMAKYGIDVTAKPETPNTP
ncbi:hypothetical protein GQ43DRAFT_423042 [Delitschia confertaspora ATCC 74209]|uniref:NADH-ubiquinone oxidoreductase 21.3 kDa subunit n=1 Tax=Delitschia confertaspora ATCC 74209 TaxID=1513339 RepID=A0A9P4MPF0_9PLEO|nr:hypothetical protein GQ43DRAFT_423042 [Delitschia confertaspora ATCC 74209]